MYKTNESYIIYFSYKYNKLQKYYNQESIYNRKYK